jgi:hypothetical protein
VEQDFPSWVVAGICALVGVFSAAVSVIRLTHLGEALTFDLGNYEYYSGYAALHGYRGAAALPGQLETYLDPQLNVIYYLLISHLSPRKALEALAVLQSIPVTLLALFVWRVAHNRTGTRLLPAIAGLLAGVAAFYSPLFGIELGEASSDVLLGTLLFVAAALLYQILTAAAAGRALYGRAVIAGLLLGVVGELKFTEMSFGLALLAGFVVALLLSRARAGWTYRRCLALVAAAILPAVVAAVALYLPMAVMLSHRYDDPLFPYFNGLFHSPYLKRGNYNPGYAAKTPISLWRHFIRLVIGGHSKGNGLFGSPVESPLLFLGLVTTAVFLVIDLVKRDKPKAVFLEISLLVGFLLWAVVFGFYRYLAPLEMATAAVVITLVLLRHSYRSAALGVVAAAIAVCVVFTHAPTLGIRTAFAPSVFAVPPNAFRSTGGDGVVLAGGGPLGYLVPDMPASTLLVRAGGNLEQVASSAWWAHVAGIVDRSHRRWWVVASTLTKHVAVSADLRQIGFSGSSHSCRVVRTALINLRLCQLGEPAV